MTVTQFMYIVQNSSEFFAVSKLHFASWLSTNKNFLGKTLNGIASIFEWLNW